MNTKLYHFMCEWFRELIAETSWEGHVYAVGGCCRDEILGLEINDMDLAVDLPNGGVKFARWLAKKRLTIGKPIYFLKYGTAKLRLKRFPDEEIELVQTRREQYTKATSRCPQVVFGTIEEDCYRRDFTANSLYYDITFRRTVDITGRGIPDMKAGILRTPMDPDETFNDDPVRILRGLRFANRFGWKIDPPVFEALLRHIDRIEIVSRERVHSELCKMINGPAPVAMMETLRSTGALAVMVPQLKGLVADSRAWGRAMDLLARIIAADPEAPTRFRLAALFMELGARQTRDVMTILRFDRPIAADVAYLVGYAGVKADNIANPRYVRAMQNLACSRRRMDLLLRFLADIGRADVAAALAKADAGLIASGKTGYGDDDRPAKPAAPAADEARPRRRRRGGRRRRRRPRPNP